MNNPNPHAKAFSIRVKDGITVDEIDDISYVDTNFLMDLNNTKSKFHSHCTNFIQMLEENDKYIAYSSWVESELNRILRLQYAKDQFNIKRPWDIDSLSTANKISINETAFGDADKLLSSLDHIAVNLGVPSEQANYEAKKISIQSGMQFDDSLHISIGLENDINSYITSDGGFLDFQNGSNNINVFGASDTISNIYINLTLIKTDYSLNSNHLTVGGLF